MATNDNAGVSPAYALSREIEQLVGVVQSASEGRRDRLSPAEHGRMVDVAEQAIATRTVRAIGDDPVVQAINRTPESHQLAAMGLARALATHDGPEHANPFQDKQLASAYANEQRFDAYLAQRQAAEKPVAGGRWIVQQWDEGRGIYRDQAQTNSATDADAMFRQSKDFRILDARFNDVAAEYPQASRSEPRGEAVYSPRSGFLQALAAEQDRPAPPQVRRGDYAHPDRQAVQERAIQAVENDSPRLMAHYRALPEAHGGRYVGADLAKELFDDYNQSREARNRYNAPVHNSAAVLAAQLFNEAVLDHSDAQRTRAVFLTGSPGAGKTTSVMAQGELDRNIAVVYEGQMFRAEQSFPKIDAALAQGLKPEIIAVHPRPETALANTFTRFDDVGRGASTTVMSQIQGELANGLREIHSRYGDRVALRIIDARDQDNRVELKGWHQLQVLESEGSKDAIKQRLDDHLERHRAAGTVTDACYRQAASLAPTRESLADRRLGAGHDPDHERIERQPRAALDPPQAQLLIASTAVRPTLRSDELARAHFVARQDQAWTERYEAQHGPDVAKRSQQLASDHGRLLADKLLNADPVKACQQFPELVNTHRSIAGSMAHLREQGQSKASIEAVRQNLTQALADRLKLGIGSPAVAVRQAERQADQGQNRDDRSR